MQGWEVFELSMLGDMPASIDLARFDAVGIHYTLHLSEPKYYFLSMTLINRLAQFAGLKCIWLHDEYRRVNAVVDTLKKININVIFSLAEGSTLEALYPKSKLPQARVETVLAGYVSDPWLQKIPMPASQRSIDVGYRARRPPYWLGALGQEKVSIGTRFASEVLFQNLHLDISVDEHDRLYGDAWRKFLGNCKTVLCVESGSSVVDFSGEIEAKVNAACSADQSLTFDEISHQFLNQVDGKHVINPISPRVIEAAASGAVMIAYEGRYSGLMHPWQHYIPLKKDFSNIEEVLAALQDYLLLEKLATNAYNDLAANPGHAYSAFTKRCALILEEQFATYSELKFSTSHYMHSQYKLALRRSIRYQFRKHVALRLQGLVLSSEKNRSRMFRAWYRSPPLLRKLLKPVLKVIGR